jgi:hypothetical protein
MEGKGIQPRTMGKIVFFTGNDYYVEAGYG